MRLLGISAFFFVSATAFADPFGPPTQLTTASVPRVEVASTTAGPLAVWIEEDGSARANGHVVTSFPTRIAVASLGDFALVVWRQQDGSVTAIRRRPDGTAAGVARRIGSNATGPVAVAAASDRYLVAWAGSLGEVVAAIVSSLGDPLVPAMPVTTQSASMIGEIAAAASGDGFAVVWHVWPEKKIFAITLSTSGAPVSMTPLLVSDHGTFPDMTSNGYHFFIAWGDGEGKTIYARTLAVDRELGRVRTVTTGVAPRLAWDGFAYGLAFAREVQPRPGFSFHVLMTMRITVYGTFVERLAPASTIVPRAFDVDARSGRLDLVYSIADVTVQSATVREPRKRIRAMRH